jgi:hypothetical protein
MRGIINIRCDITMASFLLPNEGKLHSKKANRHHRKAISIQKNQQA